VPECVQFTLFNDCNNSRLLLNAVNVQETEPFFKAGDFTVSVKTDKTISAVRLLPSREEVAFTFVPGELVFKVSDMDLFKMFEIDFKRTVEAAQARS